MQQLHLIGLMINLIKITVIILLSAASFQDIYEKKISTYIIIAAAALSLINIIISICYYSNSLLSLLISLLPGAVLLLLYLTGYRGLGLADILIILSFGGLFEADLLILILFISFMSSFIITVILLVFHKTDRENSIPFIPFLTLGTVMSLILDFYL